MKNDATQNGNVNCSESERVISEIHQVSKELLEEREVIAQLWNKIDDLQSQMTGRWDKWIQSNEVLHLAIKDLTQFVVAVTIELSNNGERMLKTTEAILELRRQLERSESLLGSLDSNLRNSNTLVDKLTTKFNNYVNCIQNKNTPESLRLAVKQGGTILSSKTAAKERLNAKWFYVLMGVMGVQCVLLISGWISQWFFQGKIPTQYPHVRLTQEDIALLEWAKSSEGKRAKNLISWNSGLLIDCTKEVEKMGIRLEVRGRKAVYGFCPLWVVPPNERRFEP